jgi:hypothetical protein
MNHTNYPHVNQKKFSNNNVNYNLGIHNEIKTNNKDNDLDKDNIQTNNNNQNLIINQNISNKNNILNNNIKIKQVNTEPLIKKNSLKKEEAYKRLRNDFDILINEKINSFINKGNAINQNIANTNVNLNMYNNNTRKKQEEAFNNYFQNGKYKIEWDKVKVKFFQNNDFFIGILEQDEKFPKKGILVSSNGEYYEGDFANGRKEGEGKLIYINGNVYEGSFYAGR